MQLFLPACGERVDFCAVWLADFITRKFCNMLLQIIKRNAKHGEVGLYAVHFIEKSLGQNERNVEERAMQRGFLHESLFTQPL